MQKSEAFKKRVDFECGYGWKHPNKIIPLCQGFGGQINKGK